MKWLTRSRKFNAVTNNVVTKLYNITLKKMPLPVFKLSIKPANRQPMVPKSESVAKKTNRAFSRLSRAYFFTAVEDLHSSAIRTLASLVLSECFRNEFVPKPRSFTLMDQEIG